MDGAGSVDGEATGFDAAGVFGAAAVAAAVAASTQRGDSYDAWDDLTY